MQSWTLNCWQLALVPGVVILLLYIFNALLTVTFFPGILLNVHLSLKFIGYRFSPIHHRFLDHCHEHTAAIADLFVFHLQFFFLKKNEIVCYCCIHVSGAFAKNCLFGCSPFMKTFFLTLIVIDILLCKYTQVHIAQSFGEWSRAIFCKALF